MFYRPISDAKVKPDRNGRHKIICRGINDDENKIKISHSAIQIQSDKFIHAQSIADADICRSAC